MGAYIIFIDSVFLSFFLVLLFFSLFILIQARKLLMTLKAAVVQCANWKLTL